MLTKGAIGNLINRYRAVLKKCNLINAFGSLAVAAMLVMGGAGVAVADDGEYYKHIHVNGLTDNSLKQTFRIPETTLTFISSKNPQKPYENDARDFLTLDTAMKQLGLAKILGDESLGSDGYHITGTEEGLLIGGQYSGVHTDGDKNVGGVMQVSSKIVLNPNKTLIGEINAGGLAIGRRVDSGNTFTLYGFAENSRPYASTVKKASIVINNAPNRIGSSSYVVNAKAFAGNFDNKWTQNENNAYVVEEYRPENAFHSDATSLLSNATFISDISAGATNGWCKYWNLTGDATNGYTLKFGNAVVGTTVANA